MTEEKRQREIAERLRRARLSAGLTQKQAAKLLGVSQAAISMQESGKRRISAAVAEELTEIYGAYRSEHSEKREEERLIGTEAARVLTELAALGGEELKNAAGDYLALCSYILIRRIYTENPKNSSRPFSLSESVFNMLCEMVEDEPDRVINFMKYSHKVQSTDIKPDAELAGRLRAVIDECEEIFKGTGQK